MLPCMCCLFFWGCHKHNSLTLGPIQPSSPSTTELLAQSGHPECSKAIKISDRLHKCISHLNQITFERMNFAKDATIFKLYLNFKIDLFQGPIIQLVAGISQSTKDWGRHGRWICLNLPSRGPGFKSHAHHLIFYCQIWYSICHCVEKKDENEQKEVGFGPYFLKRWVILK